MWASREDEIKVKNPQLWDEELLRGWLLSDALGRAPSTETASRLVGKRAATRIRAVEERARRAAKAARTKAAVPDRDAAAHAATEPIWAETYDTLLDGLEKTMPFRPLRLPERAAQQLCSSRTGATASPACVTPATSEPAHLPLEPATLAHHASRGANRGLRPNGDPTLSSAQADGDPRPLARSSHSLHTPSAVLADTRLTPLPADVSPASPRPAMASTPPPAATSPPIYSRRQMEVREARADALLANYKRQLELANDMRDRAQDENKRLKAKACTGIHELEQELEQEHKKVDQLAAEKFAIKTILMKEIRQTEPDLTRLRFSREETECLREMRDRAVREEEKMWMKLTVARHTPCASCAQLPQWESDSDCDCES